MKTNLLINLALIFSLFLSITSCSKDNGTEIDDMTEKIIKFEISYSGEYTYFKETFDVQVISSKSLSVNGVNWDEVTSLAGIDKQFLYSTKDIDGKTKTLVTSEKSSVVTLAHGITPKIYPPKDNIVHSMILTVKLYIDDKLTDTRIITATSTSVDSSITFPVVASQY